MSFVNLIANDVWSETDIVRRTEAMIRSEFSLEAETILNRKVLGITMGTYTPTPAEQAEMARYQAVVEAARDEGNAARADMALLAEVFPLETATRRLALPAVEPETDEDGNVTNAEAVAADAAEREAAQAVLDAASPEAIDLFNLRNPPPEEDDDTEEQAAVEPVPVAPDETP
jgi:hypothetical protein